MTLGEVTVQMTAGQQVQPKISTWVDLISLHIFVPHYLGIVKLTVNPEGRVNNQAQFTQIMWKSTGHIKKIKLYLIYKPTRIKVQFVICSNLFMTKSFV